MVHLVEAVDTTMATVAAVVDTAAEATVVAAAGKLYLFENLFEFAFCRSLMTAMLTLVLFFTCSATAVAATVVAVVMIVVAMMIAVDTAVEEGKNKSPERTLYIDTVDMNLFIDYNCCWFGVVLLN